MEPKVDLKAERDTGQPIDINQWLLYCSGLLVVTTRKTTTTTMQDPLDDSRILGSLPPKRLPPPSLYARHFAFRR